MDRMHLPAHRKETSRPLEGAGRWGREPSEKAADPPTLKWVPVETLAERIRRTLNVPTAIAIVVFGAAVIVTSIIMFRGLNVDAEQPSASFAAAESPASNARSTETTGADSSAQNRDHSIAAQQADANTEGETAVATVFVHVVGEVRSPGVFELAEGQRVSDAIEAAGGVTEHASVEAINLARVLSDGEQVFVPDVEAAEARQGALFAPTDPSSRTSSDNAASPGAAVNVNTADADQLQQLPGIGPALAQRIVDWRDANGGFSSVDQLLEVSGIGFKTLDRFKELVTL